MTTVRAPGRVNLIGEHTDYHGGLCLPLAIDRACTVVHSPDGGDRLRLQSEQLDGVADLATDGSDDPRAVEPRWGRFAAGVVRVLIERGATVGGGEITVASTVPAGAGLSSSSALTVALVLALGGGARLDLDDRREVARVALDAEVAATGVRGGLMDQMASLFGVAGHALLIDCRDLAVTPVALPSTHSVLVVHSGLPRTLAGTAYSERRAACDAAAHRLGLATLRDATAAQVAGEPIARHVVNENTRVVEFADALVRNDVHALGPLLLASHASLRDDFEVSTRELDLLVDLLVAHGAIGARLTGAGFGGCVIALVQRNHADDCAAKTVRAYAASTGLEPRAFVVRAVDGAAVVGGDSEVEVS